MLKSLLNIISLSNFKVTLRRRRLFLLALFLTVLLAYFRTDIIIALDGIPYIIELFQVTAFALFTYMVTSSIRMIIVSSYRKKHDLREDRQDNFTVGASALVGILTTLTIIFWSLSIFEVEIFTFFTSLTIVSIALATIFKDIIRDYIEGLMILFTANYKVGDYVQVGKEPRGVITNISLSKTELRIEDGSSLFISNHDIRNNTVINLSKKLNKQVVVTITVQSPKLGSVAEFETNLIQFLQQELGDKVNADKTTVSIFDSEGEKVKLLCEVTLQKYGFTIEKKVRHLIHQFILSHYSGQQAS